MTESPYPKRSQQRQQQQRPKPTPQPKAKPPKKRGASSLFLFLILMLGLAAMAWGAIYLVGRIADRFSSEPTEVEVVPEDTLPPEPVTPHLDFTGFNPGNIISDEVFYDSTTMDEQQVQAFLDKVGEGCREGIDGTQCLAVYTENSPSFEANDHCFAFEGTSDDTAASIVIKAANACKINPQVLLVILQKEQGLLTSSGEALHATRYDTAMGYACPDTADCGSEFFGLGNQVYHAALQMRAYANNPEKYQVIPFEENDIFYSPDPECGDSKVYIENYATAGLYNYTPYQPDQDALNGTPGECSAVGNLNFYGYFEAWFGE